jgi:hypothetical protein
MRSFLNGLLAVCIALTLVMAVSAQDKKDAKKMPTPEEQQKMMADYMKLIAPGAHHKIFENMVGEHTTSGKMWMSADGEPMTVTPGTEKSELILGGRYLQTHQFGNWMGMPYEGVCLMAYDNFRQKYMMTLMDNFGTAICSATGDYDAVTKTLTYLGKMDDPQSGQKDLDVKYVYKFADDKPTVFEMWMMNPNKPYKVMEMTYTKK